MAKDETLAEVIRRMEEETPMAPAAGSEAEAPRRPFPSAEQMPSRRVLEALQRTRDLVREVEGRRAASRPCVSAEG